MDRLSQKTQAVRKRTASTALKLVLSARSSFTKANDHLLIACMPKSGSTFLTNVIAEISGYQKTSLSYAYMQSEQDLYLPKLIDSWGYPSVTQQHVKATAANLGLVQQFSLKPVVLLRNVFDVIVSLRDHIHNESDQNPIFITPRGFSDMDEGAQIDCIIDLGIPWYLGFVASWNDAMKSGEFDVLQITYERLMADKVGVIGEVMQHFHLPFAVDKISEGLERVEAAGRSRLNKGVSGRGAETLSDKQRARIESLASYYPRVDFTPIGISL